MDKPMNLDETKFDYNFWTKIGESANSLEIKKRNTKKESQFITSRSDSYENEQLALVNDLLQDLINNVINVVESSLEYDAVANPNTMNYSNKDNKLNYQVDEDLIRSKWPKKSDLPKDILASKQNEEQQHLIKTLLEDISILKSNEYSKLEPSTDNNRSFVNADNRLYSKSANEQIKIDSLNDQDDSKYLMADNNRFHSIFKQNTADLKANCDEIEDKNSVNLHLYENKTYDENNANDSLCFTHELNRSDEQVNNLVINNDDVTNELNCFLDRHEIKIDNINYNNNNKHISNQSSNQIEKQSKFF